MKTQQEVNAYMREWRRKRRAAGKPVGSHVSPAAAKAYDINYRSSRVGRISKLLNNARKRAVARGQEMVLTDEWVGLRLDRGYCELTGLPLVLATMGQGRHPFAPSIDRIDSSLGYTPENSRMIITAANLGRSAWSDEVLLTWATALVRKHDSAH